MTMLIEVMLAAAPVLAVIGWCMIAARRERRRQEAADRQIALTEAIHRTLGAVAAPTVVPARRGMWRVTIPVVVDRPEVIAAIVGTAHRVIPRHVREIVLIPMEPGPG